VHNIPHIYFVHTTLPKQLNLRLYEYIHNLTTIYQKTKIILLIQIHLLNFYWIEFSYPL
jgi:hypothetical protein